MRFTATVLIALSAVGAICLEARAQQPAQTANAAKPALYNTAKQKLLEGKRVFSYTQSKFDIAANCESAKHYDYTWYEMQHSTLEFKDVEVRAPADAVRPTRAEVNLEDAAAAGTES